jgi:hypothetical protein
MRHVSLLMIFIWATARANPSVPLADTVYMSSERLTVIIGPTEAEFRGTFTFRSAGPVSDDGEHASLAVPIWFPARAQKSNPSIAAFWSMFNSDYHSLVSTKEKEMVEKTLGLKAYIDKKEFRAENLFISGWPANHESVPKNWEQPGWKVLRFDFTVSPNVIEDATPVIISYRQPLIRDIGKWEFVYVPVFAHLPKGISTSNTNRYSITLTADPYCDLTVTNGEFNTVLLSGQRITLTPKDLQAIHATVLPRRTIPVLPKEAASGN